MQSPRLAFLPMLREFNAEIKIWLPDPQPLQPISPITYQDSGDSVHGDEWAKDPSPGSWEMLMRHI
jgi:hypothetical protein